MKKWVLLKFLFVVLLFLSACTPEKKTEYDLSGKTYYATKETNSSKLWLAKDGMFVLMDGAKEISGNWSVEENVLNLSKIDNSGNIRFEVKDEHNIILKSSLENSSFDDVFSDDAKYNTAAGNTPDPNNTAPSSDKIVLYNASWEPGKDKPYVELRPDGTFTFVDMPDFGPVEITGRYGTAEDGTIMFSNFEPFSDILGDDVYNFELLKASETEYLLNEELVASRYGDQFNLTGDYNHYLDYYLEPKVKSSTWVHEPTDQSSPEYYPKFTIINNYSFTFEENVYACIASIIGYCEQKDNGWGCTITDNSQMTGFAGQDVKYLEFKYDTDKQTLILQNDLCMSRAGDKFLLQP